MNRHIQSLNMSKIGGVYGEGWARGIHIGTRFVHFIFNGQIFFEYFGG